MEGRTGHRHNGHMRWESTGASDESDRISQVIIRIHLSSIGGVRELLGGYARLREVEVKVLEEPHDLRVAVPCAVANEQLPKVRCQGVQETSAAIICWITGCGL